MISCEDIQQRAAYLAALPESDPERKLAYEHARGHPECARALVEGERLIALLDQLPAPAPPTDVALRRASEDIVRELDELPVARKGTVPNKFLLSVSIFAGWAIAVGAARHRAADRASWLWSAAILIAATSGLAAAMRFDAAVAGIAVALSALFSAVVGTDGALSAAIGVKCVMTELITAALPLGTTAFLVVTRRAENAPWRLPASATLGALAGHAALHLTCPVRTASPHLFVFHTGGVLLAAMLGLLVARIPALRPR